MFHRVAILALLAGSTAAFAQDSVSRNANGGSGLPGDGLSPWASANQRASYIVDLSPLRTASGTLFGVAPLIKSGHVATSRFASVPISASLAQALRTGAPAPATSYALWAQPGAGLNSAENNTALNTAIAPPATCSIFAAAVLDLDETLAGTATVLTNHAMGAQVAFDPGVPARLYVTRVDAACNSSTITQPDRSQIGLGAIDAEGNLCLRADGFSAAVTGTTLLVGDNYFRIRLPARGTSVDVIDNSGGTQAAANDWLLVRNPVTVAVPSAIPATLAGRSVLVGADFIGRLLTESTPGVLTSATGYRPGTIDHRGAATVSAANLFPGSVASGGILTRSNGGGGKTDSISVFGLTSAGAIAGARTVTIPATITDACDAFSWPLSGGSIRGYDSQSTFRGGVGPVAITRDQAGRALAAATLYSGAIPNPASPYNAIAVARFDPAQPNGPVTWTAAAWVDSAAMNGKSIQGDYGQDGCPNTHDAGEGDGVVNGLDAPIGRLASLNESSLGLSGPSLSSPAFDSVGNIYFIASASLNRRVGNQTVQDSALGLFRAVYNPATFCYSLDLVLRVGDVFPGANSGRPYQVQSIALADSDSVASGSLWSSSVTQQAWNAIDPSPLAPADPQTLGGLVLTARIVYDTDANGLFQDPSAAGSNLASPDEAYNVVLYVGNTTPPTPTCEPDVNQDGNVDQDDVAYLINVIGGGPNPTGIDPDFNQDGNADQDDVSALINVVAGGPCP